MTPQKLAKIRAVAEDPRGDPMTREVARATLKRYATVPATPKPPSNPLHPGMRRSAEIERYKFMDLSQWKTNINGDLTILVARNAHPYRVTLFQHKKTPTWGWSRLDIIRGEVDYSGRFATLTEAHEAAWKAMNKIMVSTSP
jgi:hypothetical protein